MFDLSAKPVTMDTRFQKSYTGKKLAILALSLAFILGGVIAHSQLTKGQTEITPERITLDLDTLYQLKNTETIEDIKAKYKASSTIKSVPVSTYAVTKDTEETVETDNIVKETKIEDYFNLTQRGVAPDDSKKELVKEVIKLLPVTHTSTLSNLILRYDNPTAHRGLGGKSTIILRAVEVTDDEFMSLLIHELGHTVDLGLVVGSSTTETNYFDGNEPIYADDKSVDFYSICWSDTETQSGSCSTNDFVSGYASSDAFEDFAESYLAYVLHGKEFRKISGQSSALTLKYAYLKDLFNGKEFDTGNLDNISTEKPWDMTLVPLT